MNDLTDDLDAIARIDAIPMILEVACRTTGMGFSAVARVTEDRWVACAVRDEIAFGLQPGGELQIATTICNEVRDTGQMVVFDHASQDETYGAHPTPKLYGFESYISVPIRRPDGRFFGTLCAIDPKPARPNTPEIVGMFRLFADLIGFHLDSQEQLETSKMALQIERETAEFREQFLAVLGHDLRNPLASIDLGAQALLATPQTDRTNRILNRILRSAGRMSELVDNVLDFARGKLGGGLPISPIADRGLTERLEHVAAELRSAWPQRRLDCCFDLNQPVWCDGARIAQLFSNLLGNAFRHGDPAGPVWVEARSDGHHFELSVSNTGATLTPEVLDRMFEPFTRSDVKTGQQGLGLGLYIASEIARAHRGTIQVTSSSTETRFAFHMPVRVS